MSVSVTAIRAGITRYCLSQGELALALGIPCTTEFGLGSPLSRLDDLDMEAVAEAAGYRLTDEAYGTDYVLRPAVHKVVHAGARAYAANQPPGRFVHLRSAK